MTPITRCALALCLAGAMLIAPARADDISWTYAEIHTQYVDPKRGGSDTGYRIEGSLGLPLGFHALARWEKASLDDVEGDLSGADLGIGVGG